MGDHQCCAAVVARQTPARKILLDLEGEQVPGCKHTEVNVVVSHTGADDEVTFEAITIIHI